METSESGSPIYRYSETDINTSQAPAGESAIEEITAHVEKYVGEVHMVFHELISEFVHVDILWVRPTSERPFHTLITSGMSDLPMQAPAAAEEHRFAELSICLPPDWKISEEDFTDMNNYWPVAWLKYLARFPHVLNTWLSFGHTIPNGNPAEPFAPNTQLNTMLLLPTIVFEEAFRKLELDNKTIEFYALVPLYTEEVELKMKKGVDALFDGFHKYHVSDLLDLKRPNTAKRKKLFGLF